MVSETINPYTICGRCGKNSILTDDTTGERFCSKCGYVISETLSDTGPEWRSFSKGNGVDPTRTGAPTSLTMYDKGLATNINPINKDASGNSLSASMKSTIERLRTLDNRSKVNNHEDKNLRQALTELSTLKDKLFLSTPVIEKAAYIYRKALEKKLIRGRTISALIASSLYAACRDAEISRTLKDISEASHTKRKDVARCYRLIHRELELKMPVVDSVQCVARIASKLNITEKTKRYGVKIIKEAQKHEETAGKDPMGLAAAALYLECIKNVENKSQHSIAEASGITEVTIRNRCKGLRLDQDMDF